MICQQNDAGRHSADAVVRPIARKRIEFHWGGQVHRTRAGSRGAKMEARLAAEKYDIRGVETIVRSCCSGGLAARKASFGALLAMIYAHRGAIVEPIAENVSRVTRAVATTKVVLLGRLVAQLCGHYEMPSVLFWVVEQCVHAWKALLRSCKAHWMYINIRQSADQTLLLNVIVLFWKAIVYLGGTHLDYARKLICIVDFNSSDYLLRSLLQCWWSVVIKLIADRSLSVKLRGQKPTMASLLTNTAIFMAKHCHTQICEWVVTLWCHVVSEKSDRVRMVEIVAGALNCAEARVSARILARAWQLHARFWRRRVGHAATMKQDSERAAQQSAQVCLLAWRQCVCQARMRLQVRDRLLSCVVRNISLEEMRVVFQQWKAHSLRSFLEERAAKLSRLVQEKVRESMVAMSRMWENLALVIVFQQWQGVLESGRCRTISVLDATECFALVLLINEWRLLVRTVDHARIGKWSLLGNELATESGTFMMGVSNEMSVYTCFRMWQLHLVTRVGSRASLALSRRILSREIDACGRAVLKSCFDRLFVAKLRAGKQLRNLRTTLSLDATFFLRDSFRRWSGMTRRQYRSVGRWERVECIASLHSDRVFVRTIFQKWSIRAIAVRSFSAWRCEYVTSVIACFHERMFGLCFRAWVGHCLEVSLEKARQSNRRSAENILSKLPIIFAANVLQAWRRVESSRRSRQVSACKEEAIALRAQGRQDALLLVSSLSGWYQLVGLNRLEALLVEASLGGRLRTAQRDWFLGRLLQVWQDCLLFWVFLNFCAGVMRQQCTRHAVARIIDAQNRERIRGHCLRMRLCMNRSSDLRFVLDQWRSCVYVHRVSRPSAALVAQARFNQLRNGLLRVVVVTMWRDVALGVQRHRRCVRSSLARWIASRAVLLASFALRGWQCLAAACVARQGLSRVKAAKVDNSRIEVKAERAVIRAKRSRVAAQCFVVGMLAKGLRNRLLSAVLQEWFRIPSKEVA